MQREEFVRGMAQRYRNILAVMRDVQMLRREEFVSDMVKKLRSNV